MRVNMGTFGTFPHAPFEEHPLNARREPSALEGWILEVLYCDPQKTCFQKTCSLAGLFCVSFLRKGKVFACVGLIQNLKDSYPQMPLCLATPHLCLVSPHLSFYASLHTGVPRS